MRALPTWVFPKLTRWQVSPLPIPGRDSSRWVTSPSKLRKVATNLVDSAVEEIMEDSVVTHVIRNRASIESAEDYY